MLKTRMIASPRIKKVFAPLLMASLLAVSLGLSIHRGLFEVKHVVDGDTLILENNVHVRLISIDAPETAREKKPAEPYADQAHEALRKLVDGKKVHLEYDQEKQDRYGRTLAYVFLKDGTLVNEYMVAEGLALAYYHHPNTLHFKTILEAQQQAMDARKGLWADWSPPGFSVIANTRTKRVHFPKCRSISQTHPKNRARYNSLQEALYQGNFPCNRCLKKWQSF